MAGKTSKPAPVASKPVPFPTGTIMSKPAPVASKPVVSIPIGGTNIPVANVPAGRTIPISSSPQKPTYVNGGAIANVPAGTTVSKYGSISSPVAKKTGTSGSSSGGGSSGGGSSVQSLNNSFDYSPQSNTSTQSTQSTSTISPNVTTDNQGNAFVPVSGVTPTNTPTTKSQADIANSTASGIPSADAINAKIMAEQETAKEKQKAEADNRLREEIMGKRLTGDEYVAKQQKETDFLARQDKMNAIGASIATKSREKELLIRALDTEVGMTEVGKASRIKLINREFASELADLSIAYSVASNDVKAVSDMIDKKTELYVEDQKNVLQHNKQTYLLNKSLFTPAQQRGLDTMFGIKDEEIAMQKAERKEFETQKFAMYKQKYEAGDPEASAVLGAKTMEDLFAIGSKSTYSKPQKAGLIYTSQSGVPITPGVATNTITGKAYTGKEVQKLQELDYAADEMQTALNNLTALDGQKKFPHYGDTGLFAKVTGGIASYSPSSDEGKAYRLLNILKDKAIIKGLAPFRGFGSMSNIETGKAERIGSTFSLDQSQSEFNSSAAEMQGYIDMVKEGTIRELGQGEQQAYTQNAPQQTAQPQVRSKVGNKVNINGTVLSNKWNYK